MLLAHGDRRMVCCNMCADKAAWVCADAFTAPGVEIKAIASYKGPLLPADEDERMRTVCCVVQNDEDDPVLSSICKLVCSLLRVPSAGLHPTPKLASCTDLSGPVLLLRW